MTTRPVTIRPSKALNGSIRVPGDKSISHRALMFGALAAGETRVSGLLEGEDVLATAAAMRALGAEVERTGPGDWTVYGRGLGALIEPDRPLDMGNAGTGVRLLMGLVASHPIRTIFTGDASLSRRPMARVATPLTQCGAAIDLRDGEFLPAVVAGAADPLPLDYEVPVASAQVKSAILLAGLNAPGTTIVTEPVPTRDHSERLLAAFGAEIATEEADKGGRRIRLTGQPELVPQDIRVPADISSAAFPIVAALITPGSEVRIERAGVNPLRDGILTALKLMGGDVELENRREVGGEPVADIVVRASRLEGIDLDPIIAASMIDEFPVLFVAAACARGRSRFTGLEELRVKESDRLAAMAAALSANGVAAEEHTDGLTVTGCDGPVPGGGTVDPRLDHRIAMAGYVMGLAAEEAVAIADMAPVETSFPGFTQTMQGLGANRSAGAKHGS